MMPIAQDHAQRAPQRYDTPAPTPTIGVGPDHQPSQLDAKPQPEAISGCPPPEARRGEVLPSFRLEFEGYLQTCLEERTTELLEGQPHE